MVGGEPLALPATDAQVVLFAGVDTAGGLAALSSITAAASCLAESARDWISGWNSVNVASDVTTVDEASVILAVASVDSVTEASCFFTVSLRFPETSFSEFEVAPSCLVVSVSRVVFVDWVAPVA